MAKLTSGQRKALPASTFAVDGKKRKYPIPDEAHARNALARVSQFGTPAEKAQVRRDVQEKFPGIMQDKGTLQSGSTKTKDRVIVSPEGIQGAKMRRHGKRHAKR